MGQVKRDTILKKDTFQSIYEQSPNKEEKMSAEKIKTFRESVISLDFDEEQFLESDRTHYKPNQNNHGINRELTEVFAKVNFVEEEKQQIDS